MTQAQIDSLRADSLRLVDSIARANIPSARTTRYLDSKAQERVLLPVQPQAGGEFTMPVGSRRIFVRDSIDWATAQTLSDLLSRVPGMTILRGGSFGRPELPNYQGRGAAAVEYWLDGVPYLPLGPDSAAVDPSALALWLLDRVEVEQGLGLLRVHLYTRQHAGALTRTRVGFGSGDQGLGRYAGSFERRYPSGLGLSLLADNFSINAPTDGSGGHAATNGLIQLSWVPHDRLGLQYQMAVLATDREALLRDADTLSPVVQGTRVDQQLRLAWRATSGPLSRSLHGVLGTSSWRGDDVSQSIRHAGVIAATRTPTWSAQGRLFAHSGPTPFDLRLDGGWSPSARTTGSLELVWQEHTASRSSQYLTGRFGTRLPLGVDLVGMVRNGHRVQSPALVDESEQRFTDLGWTASWQRERLGVEVGYARNDGWRPVPFRQLTLYPYLYPLPTTEWLTVDARYRVYNWLSLESTYSHPLLGAQPNGAPPHQARTTATVHSKFLHNFPSTAFDLKVQVMAESWSTGVVGLDRGGDAVAMPGRTFLRGVVQLRIGPFIAYYDRVNLRGRAQSQVRGYPVPALSSLFGVRWAFSN